jgi:F-type H+-transporting ATPase subunit b
MELISPSFGLIFWMLLGFLLLFIVLRKFAWPVILGMISKREKYIEEQLNAAEAVRHDMASLRSEHQQLLIAAKEERDQILAEARKLRDKLYEETKQKANNEANAILEETKRAIQFEKMKVMTDMKNEIASMSIEIAEKLVRHELSEKRKSEELVEKWMQDIHLN